MGISEKLDIVIPLMGLAGIIAILCYSVLFLIYASKMVRKDYKAKIAAKFKSKEELQIAKENFTRDNIILAVLFFETLYRIVGVADIFFIISKQGFSSEFSLAPNCSLQAGTSIALFYSWGWPYVSLVGANYACNVFILSLVCILSIYIINIHITHQRVLSPTSLKFYTLYSIVKCVLIPISMLIAWLLLLGQIFYIVVFSIDYILYIITAKKLHQILKRKCVEVKNHGSEAEVKLLWLMEKKVRTYKVFSLILIFGYGMEILGQMMEVLVVAVAGNLLFNPCWFRMTYYLDFNFSFERTQFITVLMSTAVYGQFIGGSLLNISLLLVYSMYSWEQIKIKYKQARAHRFQVLRIASLSATLLN